MVEAAIAEESETTDSGTVPVRSQRRYVVLAYLSCVCIWGTTYFAVRQSVLQPGGFHPYTACTVRFAAAVLCICFLWLFGVGRSRVQSWRAAGWTLVAALASVGSFALVYNAHKWISGGFGAVIATTSPLMTALVVSATRTERVQHSSIVGSLIAIAGIAVIFRERLAISANEATGVLMLLASVFVNTCAAVLLKRELGEQRPFVTVSIYILVSICCFALLSYALEGGVDLNAVEPRAIVAACYLGVVGSVLSFSMYFYLLRRVSLMTLSTLVFFPPLLALVIDSFWEKGVILSATSYSGMAVVLAGVAVSVFAQRFRRGT